ncbi:hypothetical protein Zmor_021283 [Zophobas morio]|uniref:Uncharacterized protein n=1 Tax=Zophobas morio TaxID=2755281 RepID=A0AA38I604_9CUCU|nr:hypothetical protein Zmor_021283 [Zophobas morio]
MTFMKKFIKFCNDNVVMISGLSIIVGVHWGWSKLQDVPALVRPEEKKDLPLIVGTRKLGELIEHKYHELTDAEPKQP